MKMVAKTRHHKAHKHSISGLTVGGLLLIGSAFYLRMQNTAGFNHLAVYITLFPGAALILRSLHPPMGILRGIMTFTGGALLGTFPILFINDSTRLIAMGIVAGLIGAILLGASFTEKPKC